MVPNLNSIGPGGTDTNGQVIKRNNDDDKNHHDGVVIGPDLNPTRSHMDRKLYRHITLPNGLKCVLICDTVAMRQMKLDGCGCDDDSDVGDDDDDAVDEETQRDDDDDDDGLRKAAAALLVNVGSYHDPPHLQGLSHFLEHMLFLGTEAFPGENEYDSFLSQQGGDDNAYTDMEHTVYHFCIPQGGSGGGFGGERNVWKALEMFSSFFKCPLLRGEMAERELKAVESEFELNKMDDECRWQQLMCFTCGMDGNAPLTQSNVKCKGENGSRKKPCHPFAKFCWGNIDSLKNEPEANGIDVMKELRDFYHTHYYARNMRLVVMAGYDLDEIQRYVVEYFKDVPADPRIANNSNNSALNGITNLEPYKLPFHPSSLQTLYRILPVRHGHSLTLTWQIPSICPHWRSKPADYLAHLVGHEASGSILSTLKRRGWAMSCSAGTGDDGLGDASTHALFVFHVSLSKRGVGCWKEVVKVVFEYIGMLRHNFLKGYIDDSNVKVEGLPPWIYDELKSISELSYRYANEGDVTDIVEEIAENMAPWYGLPEERFLDGDALLFDDVVNHLHVKDLLFNYFTPENLRVDFMSSLFGREADFDDYVVLNEQEYR